MAITITVYDFGKANLLGGDASGEAPIDFLSDTIKVSLHTSTYSPAAATDDFWNDASNELAAGNGYTANGEALASKTVTVAGGNADFDAADVSWTFTASKTFRYAVIYKDTGTASTSPLIAYVDFGTDRVEDSTFTIVWNASGILRLD